MKTETFLFELGTAELPAKQLTELSTHLAELMVAGLADAHIPFNKAHLTVYATPRRLALCLTELADQALPQVIDRRGPTKEQALDSTGQPTPALLGFLKSCDATLADLTEEPTPKGIYFKYQAVKPGQMTKDLLPEIIVTAFKKLPLKKPMRWGQHEFAFLRPVHWVLALYGEMVIPVALFGHKASNLTYGHRFHHPEAIPLSHPDHYESLLFKAKVVASIERRKAIILDQIEALISVQQEVKLDLLNEVVNLVEWPCSLLGNFSPEFLRVPKEVLIAAMETHQKCFPILKRNNLEAHFITVSNIESHHPLAVQQGNEKVMQARLSDAAFFYDTDLKQPLDYYVSRLSEIGFQTGLGNLLDKVNRIKHLAGYLTQQFDLDETQVITAAKLCKADLTTEMVAEFPELQGLMGKEYALKQGYDPAIAEAIEDHYKPVGRQRDLPRNPLGAVVALADKIDTLTGLFASGKKPTSSGDPFALRRQALGIISILIQFNWPLDLHDLINEAYQNYTERQHNYPAVTTPQASVLSELKVFFSERMLSWCQDYYPAIATPIMQAILNRKYLPEQEAYFNPALINARIEALDELLQTPAGSQFMELAKRISNILSEDVGNLPDISLFTAPEQALWRVYQEVKTTLFSLPIKEQYFALLKFQAPIARFFDDILVNDPDLRVRENRHALLKQLHRLFEVLAHFA